MWGGRVEHSECRSDAADRTVPRRLVTGGELSDSEPSDLAVPPGNRLEKLKGARAGQYSIRANDQYRICFTWVATVPRDVEIVDYH
ncbi:MAG: type II toxin-antitoxin system RelE/ParE family toxin [Acidimicrobiales bacterium]